MSISIYIDNQNVEVNNVENDVQWKFSIDGYITKIDTTFRHGIGIHTSTDLMYVLYTPIIYITKVPQDSMFIYSSSSMHDSYHYSTKTRYRFHCEGFKEHWQNELYYRSTPEKREIYRSSFYLSTASELRILETRVRALQIPVSSFKSASCLADIAILFVT